MSLSAGERQALHTIESDLAESYPSLAAKLTTFSRVAADEAMPGHEEVKAREPHLMTPQHRIRRRHDSGGLLLWLALAVAMIAASGIGLAVSHGAGRPCTDSFSLVCTERVNPSPSRPAGPRAMHGESSTPHGSMHGLSVRPGRVKSSGRDLGQT